METQLKTQWGSFELQRLPWGEIKEIKGNQGVSQLDLLDFLIYLSFLIL